MVGKRLAGSPWRRRRQGEGPGGQGGFLFKHEIPVATLGLSCSRTHERGMAEPFFLLRTLMVVFLER